MFRKKLSAYFNNEDEALDAVTKLRAKTNARILSVEEVAENDNDYPSILPGVASFGSLGNTPSIGPNLFYPFETFEEEFGMFDEYLPAPNNRNHKVKVMVRFAVEKSDMDQAVKIVNENRGKI